jgi:hypothetical protein
MDVIAKRWSAHGICFNDVYTPALSQRWMDQKVSVPKTILLLVVGYLSKETHGVEKSQVRSKPS